MIKKFASVGFVLCVLLGVLTSAVVLGDETRLEYVPGRIIIKLKEGKTIDDLKELNAKHKVKSKSRLFNPPVDRQRTLDALKKIFVTLKDKYEKQKLNSRILAIEKTIKNMERRAKRAPKGEIAPNLDNIYVLDSESTINITEIIKDYKSDPSIEYAEPDFITYEDAIPNDTYWNYYMAAWGHNYLYGLENISAAEAWDTTVGREDVLIAPIEQGIDIAHEDLAANIWINAGEIPGNGVDDDGNGLVDDDQGAYFTGPSSYTTTIPKDYHGTHVSGTAAAVGNNAVGVVGVTWNCRLMPALGAGYTTAKAAAIQYAADNGADVITNSWYMLTTSQVVKDAIDYAHAQGCVLVASAGNRNTETLSQIPAQLPNVITVAAVDHLDRKASFSNYGVKIDVTAPGTYVGSTYPNNTYAGLSGTSMAAPHVAGLAALIISRNLDLNEADPLNHPLLTNEEIRQIIKKSATDLIDPLGDGSNLPGVDIFTGHGRIDANQALLYSSACEANITYPSANVTAYNFDFILGSDAYFNGWTIVSGPIDIKGMAQGRNFSAFKVEYGQGLDPKTWTLIHSGTTPVTGSAGDDILVGGFDANALANGPHVIRLTVTDTGGETFESRAMINVARALVTNFPTQNGGMTTPILFFEPYDIAGYATGPGFVSYHVEYGLGTDPATWIRASNDIYSPVQNGILFQDFDFTKLPDGILTLKLVVVDSLVGTSEYTFTIRNDSLHFPPQPGFPIAGIDIYGFSSPVTADIDGDGLKEIVIGADTGSSGHLYVFRSDGTLAFSNSTGPIKSSPAIGNLDDDPYLEIGVKMVSTFDNTENILIFNHDGTGLAGWPAMSFSLSPYSQVEQNDAQSSLVFFDLDQDGKDEIIFGTQNAAAGKVHVFRADGTPYPGWEGGRDTSARVAITPVAGDLDMDGMPEIVARDNNNNLYVWKADGRLLWSQPERGQYRYRCRIALADFDLDGRLEIVSSTYAPAGISFWSHTGVLLSFKDFNFQDAYSFGIGDVDDDGSPEVVVPGMGYDYSLGSYTFPLDCVKFDGTSLPNWPVYADADLFAGYPLIADLNNDGTKEILISFYGRAIKEIVAYRPDGTMLQGDNWPIRKDGYYVSSMVLDDLDGDGDTELVFRGSGGKDLRVWDLPFAYQPESLNWAMFQHDPGHSGNYQTDADRDGYYNSIDCNDQDPAVNPGAVEACTDGIDNDCDGLVDAADPNAAGCPLVCTDSDNDLFFAEGGQCGPADCNDADPAVFPGAMEVCTDGVDNDCNGLTDSLDPACSPVPEVCNDGIDNDWDGKVDCADPNCRKDAACTDGGGTSSPEVCNDGIDNDGDGKIDCSDNDCRKDPVCN